MLENYLPILIFLLMASFIGMGAILLGRLLSTNKPSKAKMSAYECGFEAFGDAHMKFDIRYYLVAILFIIFDLEIAFLFPWAITLSTTGLYGLISMGFFLLILTIGFIYEWKKGALEWD